DDGGKRGAEIDRSGRFADAALLVGKRQNTRRGIEPGCLIGFCHCHGLALQIRRAERTTTMRPDPLVRLGTRSASILQYLEASVNSLSTSWPLRNRACAPVFNNGSA